MLKVGVDNIVNNYIKKGVFSYLRLEYYMTSLMLGFFDFFSVCVAIWCAMFFRNEIICYFNNMAQIMVFKNVYLYVSVAAMHLFFIAYAGMYRRRVMFYECAEVMFKVSSYAVVLVIIVAYLLNAIEPVSRLFIFFVWLFSFIFLCIGRFLSKKVLMFLNIWERPVIIIGAGKTAELLVECFSQHLLGYHIVGFIEDVKERPLLKEYPCLGSFQDIEKVLKKAEIRDVILATPGLDKDSLVNLFYRIQPYVRNLTFVPDVFGVPIGNISFERSIDDKLLLIRTENNLQKKSNRLLKRSFDLFIGSSLCVFVLPIIFVLSILIKLDSSGPVFHVANRIGRNGKPFRCYKFRSMYLDSDQLLCKYLEKNPDVQKEWRDFAKLRGYDPRVTQIGQWIRKYSLDELPQIFNVLSGSMSLVGPRPYLPREKEQIGAYMSIICMTVPGITGLWQVSGRNNIKFEGRLKLDSWYVRNWSLWHDIVLLFKTIHVVFGKKGAY